MASHTQGCKRGFRAWCLGLVVGLSLVLSACGGGGQAAPDAAAASSEVVGTRKALAVPLLSAFTGNGWFWNPAEGGTGFMFEAQANRGFVAFFMYEEATGKPVWYAADGELAGQADGSYLFTGDLRYYENGQSVASATYRSPSSRSIGAVQISFAGSSANVQLPGGRSIAGQRFNFGGLPSSSTAVQPEVGWFYNPNEGGRGYAIEVQNGRLFMAMFHYNDDGSPTWHAVDGNIESGVVSNHFQQFAGGQSLTSGYRSPGSPANVGSYTLSFRNPCAGQLQLAGAAPVPVRRFVIGGGSQPAGSECRSAAAGVPDVPGVVAGPVRLQPGDSIYGRIDTAGDVDAYGIYLEAGVLYTFDLQGAPTGAGTLADPLLSIHGTSLTKLAENNDIAPGQLNARFVGSATVSGLYYLAAQANGAGTGSYLLSVSGVAPGLSSAAPAAVGSFAGSFSGSLSGKETGTLSLSVNTSGSVTGSLALPSAPGGLAITGSVAAGGGLRFTAGSYSFSGFVGPDGRLYGAWSDALGAGGLFAGSNASNTVSSARPASCLDGTVANAPGTEDPFYPNAWHLRNTGPGQTVSATINLFAVAGIDARVEGVHLGGRGCTGKGVAVAVVDSGLELNHEDLAPNVRNGLSFNFTNNSNDPSPAAGSTSLDHGTAVSGIVAGRGWNGLGARGLAPYASLTGFNLVGNTPLAFNGAFVRTNATLLSFGARALADTAIPATNAFGDRAASVQVFNYSAGADYTAPPFVSTNALDDPPQHRALQYGVANLRGGLGAVYFQSAGNEFNTMSGATAADPDINCVTFRQAYSGGTFQNASQLSCGNANQEPYNRPYRYLVASIHNSGQASSYSNAGASNFVTGFGGEFGRIEPAIITTDTSGCSNGSNNLANKASFQGSTSAFARIIADLFGANPSDPNCNYTGRMNGTSAAAPTVAGVAALMLEANPSLNWLDVGYILARTARRVDEGIATGSRAVSYLATGASSPVTLDDPWLTNAAGFSFQSRYGFGLVDAAAAVNMAVSYRAPAGRRSTELTVVGPTSTESPNEPLNGLKTYKSSVAFADRTAVTGQLRVDISLSNPSALAINPGLLQFELVNKATGTRSILMPAFTTWYDGGATQTIPQLGSKSFRFHSNAFYGEKLSGEFEVTVRSFVRAQDQASHSLTFRPTLTSFSL